MPPFLQEIIQEYGSNPFEALWFLFSHGLGFITIMPILIYYGWTGYVQYIREVFKRRTPYVLLKIGVPQLNEQSMKAVEQIFVHLYGSLDGPTMEELYWDGFVQENFSFEIVSDGGYITFYVRVATKYREMLEAAFYAQYPDALLTEAEDYTKEIKPEMFIEEKVKAWGSELVLAHEDVEPIKGYPAWEHGLVGRSVDPLASILEVMARLQPGEKWWLQMIAQPVEHTDFRERAAKAMNAVIEPGSDAASPNAVDKTLDVPVKFLGAVHDQIWPGDYTTAEQAAQEGGKRLYLVEPEREYVSELDRKMSRWPFNTKIRWMYIAKPNLFDPSKGRKGMYGALQQLRFINWFEEGKNTRVDKNALWWRKFFQKYRLKRRARRMFWAYRSRDMERGEHNGFILCTEELATVFHFPQIEVRAPFVTRATARGVEPPTELEYEGRSPTGPVASVSVQTAQVHNVEQELVDNVNIVPENQPVQMQQPPSPAPQAQAPQPQTPQPQSQVAPQSPQQPFNQPQQDAPVSEQGNDEPAPPSNLPFV